MTENLIITSQDNFREWNLTLELLQQPSPGPAAETIQSALQHEKLVIVLGSCTVHYKGRASSTLELGERLLIVKQDCALLIHRPRGYRPVNWQPSGCRFEISADENRLRIRAVRQNPPETIITTFDKLILVAAMTLEDHGSFSLDASEEDMQKAIVMKPALIETGLKIVEYEKRVEPGFVDVYGIDIQGRLVVIELKRKSAGKEAILQLAKYVRAISKMSRRPIRPILVAPSIIKGAQRLFQATGIEYRRLDPKQCAKILEKVKEKEIDGLGRWISNKQD